jgi:hypothetical protein
MSSRVYIQEPRITAVLECASTSVAALVALNALRDVVGVS